MPRAADLSDATPACRPPAARGIAIPVALGLLCYLTSLPNQFAYDDVAIVRDNHRIRDWSDFRAIFLTDWWQPQDDVAQLEHRHRDRLYRPLTLWSFALNYAFAGLNPLGYHLTNVLLHGIACGLAYLVIRRLVGDARVAFVAAVLFAVHPVHAEAVANVVGRAEILAAIFLLLGCREWTADHGAPRMAQSAAAALCFLFALLAKETAICYLPIALLILLAGPGAARASPGAAPLAVDRQATRRRWLGVAILLLPLLIYLPLRYVALEQHLLRDRPPSDILNPLVSVAPPRRLMLSLDVLGHYVRMMLLPQKLCASYGYGVIDPDRGPGGHTVLGLAAALLSGFAMFGLRRGAPELHRLAAWLVLLCIASYLLISNTVLLIGVAVAERLMYWPSVPFLALVSLLLVRLWDRHTAPSGALHRSKAVLRIAAIGLVAALGLRTLVRNTDWYDTPTIFFRDAREWPGSAELRNGCAKELLRRLPDLAESERRAAVMAAMEHVDAALAALPQFVDALITKARCEAALGRRDEALMLLEAALALDAADLQGRALLGMLQRKETGDAVEQSRRRLASQPADAPLQAEFGASLLQAGRYREALAYLKSVVAENPDHPVLQRLLGDAWIAHGESANAEACYAETIRLNPDDWQAHSNLVTLIVDRDAEAALRHAKAAVKLQPHEFVVQNNLAETLVRLKRSDEALAILERMLDGLPNTHPLRAAVKQRIHEVRTGARRR